MSSTAKFEITHKVIGREEIAINTDLPPTPPPSPPLFHIPEITLNDEIAGMAIMADGSIATIHNWPTAQAIVLGGLRRSSRLIEISGSCGADGDISINLDDLGRPPRRRNKRGRRKRVRVHRKGNIRLPAKRRVM